MRLTLTTAVVAGFILLHAPAAMAQATAAQGATLFAANKCAMCHAVDGKGNAKGPLDGVGAKYKADELKLWLTDPAGQAAKHNAARKPAMRNFSSLPAADIDALVAYLQTLKK